MENIVMGNIVKISLWIFIIVTFVFGFNALFKRVIVPSVERAGQTFSKTLKGRYWLITLEFLLFGVVLYWILLRSDSDGIMQNPVFQSLSFLVFMILLMIIAETGRILRLRNQLPSVLEYVISKINRKNYFVDKVKIVLEKLSSVMILFASTVILISVLQSLRLEPKWEFLNFLVIPVCTAIWVYWSPSQQEITNIKRIIAYLLLVIYSFFTSYGQFRNWFLQTSGTSFDFENFIFLISVGLFLSIDRFLKAITDDYLKYHKENRNTL